ncbi:DUF2316 family protein [Lactiplantibacillus garii]|uniref:DUF2316 family protein n=1 Tax=Lactiplantibacillus garii TaxID=2306423 RepID=A0A3R8J8D6_9LACO|nr:DUF2316 family protein [Lactiplantibacillus garii]RRK11206.1 DUF2316 family protein [Lactiplantibacillus garii]
MSLTKTEQVSTQQELRANYELSGLTLDQVADDLQTTPTHVEDVMELNVLHIEEPWILRNYLNTQIQEQGERPLPYTRLTGAPSEYWFLNQQRIQKGVLG